MKIMEICVVRDRIKLLLILIAVDILLRFKSTMCIIYSIIRFYLIEHVAFFETCLSKVPRLGLKVMGTIQVISLF